MAQTTAFFLLLGVVSKTISRACLKENFKKKKSKVEITLNRVYFHPILKRIDRLPVSFQYKHARFKYFTDKYLRTIVNRATEPIIFAISRFRAISIQDKRGIEKKKRQIEGKKIVS